MNETMRGRWNVVFGVAVVALLAGGGLLPAAMGSSGGVFDPNGDCMSSSAPFCADAFWSGDDPPAYYGGAYESDGIFRFDPGGHIWQGPAPADNGMTGDTFVSVETVTLPGTHSNVVGDFHWIAGMEPFPATGDTNEITVSARHHYEIMVNGPDAYADIVVQMTFDGTLLRPSNATVDDGSASFSAALVLAPVATPGSPPGGAYVDMYGYACLGAGEFYPTFDGDWGLGDVTFVQDGFTVNVTRTVPVSVPTDTWLDLACAGLGLASGTQLFADGYESGDRSLWSSQVQDSGAFEISAVSGGTTFTVIPEPVTLVVLLVGALAAVLAKCK